MMKHIFQCHSGEPNFSCQCDLAGCTQTFRTYSAMACHLQRKHPNYDNSSPFQKEAMQSQFYQEHFNFVVS